MDQTDQVCGRCAQRGLYFPARTVGRMSGLLQDLITDRALARPEAPAVLSEGASLPYGELDAGSDHEPSRRAEGRRSLRAARSHGARAATGADARDLRLSLHSGGGTDRSAAAWSAGARHAGAA